jgi:hypothetical protein
VGKAGGANLDWNNLGFEFRATKSHIKFVWKNGQWDQVRCVCVCASVSGRRGALQQVFKNATCMHAGGIESDGTKCVRSMLSTKQQLT